MDEGLDYSSEEQMRRASSAWAIGRHAGSVESLSKDPSKLYLQYKNYHLHLVQEMEYPSSRRTFPSTKAERFSFYRSYTTSANKCLVICMAHSEFNVMFWTYIINAFFKTLPHTYTNLFLAAYSPEEHLFIPKMVPLFYGCKIAFLLTTNNYVTMFEILLYLRHLVIAFGYLMHGIANRNPWNRCRAKEFVFRGNKITCLEQSAFAAKIRNVTWKFKDFYYLSSNGDKFQLVQVDHFRNFLNEIMTRSGTFMYLLIIWAILVLMHNLVYNRLFWKIQHRMQLSLTFVEIVLFIYLMHSKLYEIDIPEKVSEADMKLFNELASADFEFLAESMTAPPVLHVLTARSEQKIQPSYDSFLLCLSNAVSYIFRSSLLNRLRSYCKNNAGAPLQLAQYNQFAWFYFWTFFFKQFYWGELFVLGFFALNFIVDMTTLIITYHCFVEVVLCEWPFIKEWKVNLIVVPVYISSQIFFSHWWKIFFHYYTTGLANFVEIFVIYYLYPVGRLIDDIIFHYGYPPTKLNQALFRLMPIFYGVKIYIFMLDTRHLRKTKLKKFHEKWWWITFIPYIIGIIYISYKYMYKDKRGCQRMLVPDNDWGPRDHELRRLRKEFNSRTYIGSQAMRHLSRHMISKQESKAFQLNLNYNPNRRSTMAASHYRMDIDKKDT